MVQAELVLEACRITGRLPEELHDVETDLWHDLIVLKRAYQPFDADDVDGGAGAGAGDWTDQIEQQGAA